MNLIHRSKVIGQIQPKEEITKVFNAKRFAKIVNELNLPKLTQEKREKRYREAMERKRGKNIS